jgi:hypothetical protein
MEVRMTLFRLAMMVLLSLGFSAPALAQDDEVTIDVVTDQDSLPDEVTSEIELPTQASEAAQGNAGPGLDTANEAREKGREFGMERAAEARERGVGPPDQPGNQGQGNPPAGRP